MDKIIAALRVFRDDRDWTKFHTARNLATSVSIEAAELLEHFQWDIGDEDSLEIEREAVAGELADVLIYLLMLFDKLGLDPATEAMRKIESNSHRFPVGSQPGKRRRQGT